MSDIVSMLAVVVCYAGFFAIAIMVFVGYGRGE